MANVAYKMAVGWTERETMQPKPTRHSVVTSNTSNIALNTVLAKHSLISLAFR